MKVTKDLAKQQIDVYGRLLVEHAVINDIETEEKRGLQVYKFDIMASKFPYSVECAGIKELALVLTSMWSAYELARETFGLAS